MHMQMHKHGDERVGEATLDGSPQRYRASTHASSNLVAIVHSALCIS